MGNAGTFAFYRLEKRGWSTPDALAAVRRRWQIEPRRLSYGGLKDRHAWTTQYLTINHGPRRGLNHQQITLHYLGQLPTPYTSHDIAANRFQLTLRDLEPRRTGRDGRRGCGKSRRRACRTTSTTRPLRLGPSPLPPSPRGRGVGVRGGARGFIARLLVRGHFEEALKLALAGPYEHDRGEQKREKRILTTFWGQLGGL